MKLLTDHPIAVDSHDHIFPRGTKQDNSTNGAFVDKLLRLYPDGLSLLDLGCAGGGFVRSLLDRGATAFGIEGSDYSKKAGRAEWGPEGCADHLGTADITKPFSLDHEFDVVTAWEVMEHISEPDIARVFWNIDRHLKVGQSSCVFCSISPNDDVDWDVNATYHQTVQPYHWWVAKLASLGWYHCPNMVQYMGCDWVRGGLQIRETDQGVMVSNDAHGSFHLVLKRGWDHIEYQVGKPT